MDKYNFLFISILNGNWGINKFKYNMKVKKYHDNK